MLKKLIKYKDFDGNQREETFYFHIPTTKLFEMEMTTPGGFKALVEQLIQEQDVERVLDIFKGFIKASYGVKSPDGKRHMQSEELWADFVSTNAYNKLYMELVLNAEAGAAFVNGIVDEEQINEVREMIEKNLGNPNQQPLPGPITLAEPPASEPSNDQLVDVPQGSRFVQ